MPLLDLPVDETQTDGNINSIPAVRIEQPTTINGNCSHDNAVYLRAKLRFFFMSPCWKWHLKKQCPWKAWFQFIKIFLVTAQVDFPFKKKNKQIFFLFLS
jgi:hypothetical protein